jgi:hypothetical protein
MTEPPRMSMPALLQSPPPRTPDHPAAFGSWCAFEEELNKYRKLSKTLRIMMCGYYSTNFEEKIDEVSKGVKEQKELAKESKQKFNGISTKERVEHSFKRWLTGFTQDKGVRQRAKGVCEGAWI